jgi:hypothetical protein
MPHGSETVVGGGGPGGGYAELKHWLGVLLFLLFATAGVLLALVSYWPRCESCADADADASPAPPGSAAPPASVAGTSPAKAAPGESDAGGGPAVAGTNGDAAGSGAAAIATAGSTGTTGQVPAEAVAERPEPLSIDELSPTSGCISGKTPVTLSFSGVEGFTKETLPEVRFGGIRASTTLGARRNTVIAATPAHWEGVVDVTVVTARSSAQLLRGFNYTCPDRTQHRLLLLVVLAGALGGLLHGLRSLFYFIGNRNLRRSWLPMYFALPVSGAAISTVFFLVFVGGLFEPTGGDGHNYFLMVGVSALVGMFSQQAVEKLKKISEAILTATQPSADSDGDGDPVLASVVPATGVAAGGFPVKLIGSGFVPGLTVKFDDQPATIQAQSATEITVQAPAHAVGKVTIEIRNANGAKVTQKDAFEYV